MALNLTDDADIAGSWHGLVPFLVDVNNTPASHIKNHAYFYLYVFIIYFLSSPLTRSQIYAKNGHPRSKR